MGYKEKEKINEVLIEGSKKGRMFRVNAGSGYQGTNIEKLKINKTKFSIIYKMLLDLLDKAKIKIKDILILINPRYFKGLPAGVHDCIGWEVKTLCEMLARKAGFECGDPGKSCKNCHLNKKIAVFKSVEVKPEGEDLTDKQRNFRQQILKDGGISEVVYYEK